MKPEWGKITAAQIIGPIQGKLVAGQADISLAGLSTDSRKALQGELFWALKGEKYDGHDFVEKAIQSGASGIVIRESYLPHLAKHVRPDQMEAPPVIITVKDTLEALGELAGWWRRQYDVPVAAVTGSVGKTTTKEMCASILGQVGSVLKSQGNYNNLIGVPLTLLRLAPGISRVVLEMGMNRPGEIARLTQITGPDLGVITNVGKVHLEGLGDVARVARAKCELIEESSPQADIVVNGDDQLLMEAASRLRKDLFTFGLVPGRNVFGGEIQENTPEGVSFVLHYREESRPVNLKVPGRHNVRNALAAAAAGFLMGAGPAEVVKGLEEFRGIKGRFTIEQLPCGITVIDDTYNANPDALRAALETGKSLVPKGGRLLVALGDMLELGDEAPMEHRAAGRLVAEMGAACFMALGEYAHEMINGALEGGLSEEKAVWLNDRDEMVIRLGSVAENRDLVIIKGSRMIGLEEVVRKLKESVCTG